MTVTRDELLQPTALPEHDPISARMADPEDVVTVVRDLDPEEIRGMAPADARDLTRTLLKRLADLEEGTREYSYVRSTLVELNLALVRYALRRFGRRREPEEDLLQVGCVGLIKAIDRFDPDRGAEFVSFALPTILGEIRRHFRDATWAVHVPRKMQELHLDIAKAQEKLFMGLDRAPTVAELADHLGLSQEEVVEGITAANARSTGSLDLPGTDGHDETLPLAERLGDDDSRLDMAENLAVLKPLIAALPERDRLILSMRFTEDLTQSEIGARLGISQMHVSRLLSRTLQRLRASLTA